MATNKNANRTANVNHKNTKLNLKSPVQPTTQALGVNHQTLVKNNSSNSTSQTNGKKNSSKFRSIMGYLWKLMIPTFIVLFIVFMKLLLTSVSSEERDEENKKLKNVVIAMISSFFLWFFAFLMA